MLLKTLSGAALLVFCFSSLVAWPMSGDDTFVFAISACPPWKTKILEKFAHKIGSACRNDIEDFTDTVEKALGVPPAHIYALVDKQATYQGLERGMREFASRIPRDSRVILLLNLHGILISDIPGDTSGEEDVLVLWTDDKPFSQQTAVVLKQWITVRELRGMVDRIHAQEIVVIIDACHAGSAIPALMKKHGRPTDWSGREAVITSSKAKQLSFFKTDGSEAVFTSELSGALRAGSPTLRSAFENAAKKTSKYIEKHEASCKEMLWSLLHRRLKREQTPVAYDPSGLLDSIALRVKGANQ